MTRRAWIEVKARPEGGWWVIVCTARESRRTIGRSGEHRLVPHVEETWKAYTLTALRKALDAAAAVRRRLA